MQLQRDISACALLFELSWQLPAAGDVQNRATARLR